MNEKVTTIQNYLYMLVEQLRYTLHNLDLTNMNGTALEQYSASLTDPIYARIEDDEGNLTQLSLEAQGLALRISDAEGNIGALQMTATALTSQISDLNGNVSTLQQTAASLISRISDTEGNVSVLQQTASSLTSRISDAEGNISTLAQTSQGLLSRVGTVEGNYSTLQQTMNSLTLNVTNGTTSSTISLKAGNITLASKQIIMSGIVAYTEDGSPTYGIMKSDGFYLYHTDVEKPKATLCTTATGDLIQLILGAGSSTTSTTQGRFYIQKGADRAGLYYYSGTTGDLVGFTFANDGTITVHGSMPVTAVFK